MATDYYDAPAAPRNRSNEAQAWDISPAPAVGYASNRNNMFFQGEEYSEDEDDDEDSESAFGEFIDEPDGAVVGTIPITLPQLPIPIPTVPTPVPGSPDSGGDEDGGSETSSDGELYQFDQDLDSNFEGGFYEDAASVPGIGSDDDFSDNSDDQELDDEINDLGLEESAPDTSHTHGNGQEIDSSVASIAAAQAPRVQQSPVEIGHQRDDAEDTAPTSEDEDEDHEGDQEEEAEPAQPPTSFIFATTERDAYLLPTSLLSPTVVCQNFLGQPYPHTGPPYLVHVDRLNMVLPIPELSLVVAASQKGRVGIFRLTRSGKQFGMRLDTVLPREQGAPDVREADLDVETRPKAHLLGIAVSPVQGKEMGKSRAGSDSTDCGRRKKERQRGGGWRGVEGRRRWRLVIVYADGSILSYELGREREEEGQGGLGDLFGMAGFAMV